MIGAVGDLGDPQRPLKRGFRVVQLPSHLEPTTAQRAVRQVLASATPAINFGALAAFISPSAPAALRPVQNARSVRVRRRTQSALSLSVCAPSFHACGAVAV